MYQAIPALTVVQKELGGVFVSARSSTISHFKKKYPLLKQERLSKKFKSFNKGHRVMRDASVIVTGSSYQELLAPYPAKKVMVFHGTYAGISRGVLTYLKIFDYVFLNGHRMEKMLTRYLDDDAFKYAQTGFLPFDDFPEKTTGNKRIVLDNLGLDSTLKTIVYCPTSRKVGTWD